MNKTEKHIDNYNIIFELYDVKEKLLSIKHFLYLEHEDKEPIMDINNADKCIYHIGDEFNSLNTIRTLTCLDIAISNITSIITLHYKLNKNLYFEKLEQFQKFKVSEDFNFYSFHTKEYFAEEIENIIKKLRELYFSIDKKTNLYIKYNYKECFYFLEEATLTIKGNFNEYLKEDSTDHFGFFKDLKATRRFSMDFLDREKGWITNI